MRSVNKVILVGNLTRDPEMKQTTGGQMITTFGLATNRQWTTSGGQKRNSAEFHEVVTWAKLAEICKNYLKKGMLVYVEGYLKTRSWDMEDGTRRFRTEIVANDMIILEKRGDGEYEEVDRFSADDNSGFEATHAAPAVEAAPAPAVEAPAAPAVEATPAPAPEAAPAAPAASGGLSADLHDDDMF